jgi:hypothetical protein
MDIMSSVRGEYRKQIENAPNTMGVLYEFAEDITIAT